MEPERLVVVCAVTQRCNLGCAFCAYDRNLTRSRKTADPARLWRFGRLLADYQQRVGRSILVSWLGGEPLGWPPLAGLTTRFRRELGLATSVTTNGTTLGSARVRAHILDSYDELTVSVDGLEARHDALRSWPGGFASLRDWVGALVRERAERRPLVRANVVLMRDNVHELAALCDELTSWGVDEISWNQLGGNDRPAFYADHCLRSEDVAHLSEVLPHVASDLATKGVRLLGDPRYLARVVASTHRRALAVDDCQPGKTFLFVSIDGLVAPCSFTEGTVGRSIDAIDSVDDLLSLPGAFTKRRLEVRPPACDDCHSTQVAGKFEPCPCN